MKRRFRLLSAGTVNVEARASHDVRVAVPTGFQLVNGDMGKCLLMPTSIARRFSLETFVVTKSEIQFRVKNESASRALFSATLVGTVPGEAKRYEQLP
jgi:hypothetical protein